MMLLDDRKRKILRAIIDDYIDTAEPIGSRTIARKHELGLSSATIRNEMADLEEMGYLEQPHTSAGRIPSDKGYRLYVDRLMEIKQMNLEDIETIHKALDMKINELSQLIRQASIIMSKITKYTSMAITPQMDKSTLKAVQVVPIEPGKALVVVVINTGVAKNILIKIPEQAAPDFIIRLSHTVNEKLSGLTVQQINLPLIREIEREIGFSREIVMPILNGVAECIEQIDHAEVYLDGTTNILNYPEFRDVMKAKGFLDVLDEKEIVSRLLKNTANQEGNGGISIRIGTENPFPEIQDCALVTTTYSVDNIVIGSIGIIGPTRMEYGRVVSSMNYIKQKMNEEIYKLMGEDLDDS